jgi:predicted PurR-regulated permease PerM
VSSAPDPSPADPAPAAPAGPAAPATTPCAGGRTVTLPTGGPLVALAAFTLLLVGVLALKEVADLVVPIVFGLFLALVTAPVISGLERRGARRSVALTITVLVVLAVVAATIFVIALSVGEIVVQAPRYQARLTDEIAAIRELLAQYGISTDPDAITEVIQPEQVVAVLRPLASAVSHAGVAIFILAFTLIYALAGAGTVRARAVEAFGADHPLIAGIERFGVDLRRYLIVRAQLGLFAAVLSVVLLFVLGVPYPLLWGVLVFAASFIPNVGFLIALIPPAVLGFFESGLVTALLVIAGYAAINFLQDHLLQPIVMGSELNLTPLVVMLSVIAWAWILGAAGALLAVPLTVGLVAIMEAWPSTRSIAALMRNKSPAQAGDRLPPDETPAAA